MLQTLRMFAIASILLGMTSCHAPIPTIAVIPPVTGTLLWETMHGGAAAEARKHHLHLYWNAPPEEGDTQKQIGFLERALNRHYAGIVLVPDETFAFRTPVQHAIDNSVPVVVINNELGLPSERYLSYVLNDEVEGGRLAARRVAAILHGKGSIAILGTNPHLQSLHKRELSLERTLATEFPQIHIAVRKLGDRSLPHEQQTAEQLFDAAHPVDAIIALTTTSMRGAYYAQIETQRSRSIPIIGFDQERLPAIKAGEIDSIVIQNTFEIGRIALSNIAAEKAGDPVAERVYVKPILLTRANLDSPQLKRITLYPMFPWSEQ
jgi:ribose transport system substrate-binding protein